MSRWSHLSGMKNMLQISFAILLKTWQIHLTSKATLVNYSTYPRISMHFMMLRSLNWSRLRTENPWWRDLLSFLFLKIGQVEETNPKVKLKCKSGEVVKGSVKWIQILCLDTHLPLLNAEMTYQWTQFCRILLVLSQLHCFMMAQ